MFRFVLTVLFVALTIIGCDSGTKNFLGIEDKEPDPFDITLKGVDALPIQGWQRLAIEQAAKQWEQVIVEGFPDLSAVPDVGNLDDFLIEFEYHLHQPDNKKMGDQEFVTFAGSTPTQYRGYERGLVPFRGKIVIYPALVDAPSLTNAEWQSVIMHEIGHVLGFSNRSGSSDGFKGLSTMKNINGKMHFTGPLAAEAYQEILFRHGIKNVSPDMLVPLANDHNHWDQEALKWDIMSPIHVRGAVLTAVTIQAMADMGYTVDVDQAKSPSPLLMLAKPTVAPRFYCDGQHITLVQNP